MAKSELRQINDHGHVYQALAFICPGCEVSTKGSGLHMLPVSGDVPERVPRWDWDGNLEAPTLSPSILTRHGEQVCHSFLKAGQFQFLSDSTHQYSGQTVEIPDVPEWFKKE